MLSDERLAQIKAWFNDPTTMNISAKVLGQVNALLTDAQEARVLLWCSLSELKAEQWSGYFGELCLACGGKPPAKGGSGHVPACTIGRIIAKLEAALMVTP